MKLCTVLNLVSYAVWQALHAFKKYLKTKYFAIYFKKYKNLKILQLKSMSVKSEIH